MQASAYRCDTCECEYRFFDRNAAVYGPPAHLRIPQRPAWCVNCEALTPAEYVPSEAAILTEVQALRRGDEHYPYRLVASFSPQYPGSRLDDLAYLDRLLYWRRRRVSPAHCPDCGSTDLLFAPSRNSSFPYPDCEGTLHPRFPSGGAYLPITRAVDIYSDEGIRIATRAVL